MNRLADMVHIKLHPILRWLLASSAVAGTIVSACQAQTSEAPASAKALKLAHALHDQPVTPELLRQAADSFAHNLLFTLIAGRGLGCDPAVPACRAAANRIALEVAPRLIAEGREVRSQVLAIVIDETMTSTDIDKSIAFMETSAGKGLAFTMTQTSIEMFMSSSPETRRKIGEVMKRTSTESNRRDLFERFYNDTATLPRTSAPVAPPPPSSPVSRRP